MDSDETLAIGEIKKLVAVMVMVLSIVKITFYFCSTWLAGILTVICVALISMAIAQ